MKAAASGRDAAAAGAGAGGDRGGRPGTVALLVAGGLVFLFGCVCLVMWMLFLITGYRGWDLWLLLLVGGILPCALGVLALAHGFRRLESSDSTEELADGAS